MWGGSGNVSQDSYFLGKWSSRSSRSCSFSMIPRLFAFGDLRPPNVVFSGGRVLLVDFDWAGRYGQVCYPTGLGDRTAKGSLSYEGG